MERPALDVDLMLMRVARVHGAAAALLRVVKQRLEHVEEVADLRRPAG